MSTKESRERKRELKPAVVLTSLVVLILATILAGWYFTAGVTAPNVIGASVDEAAASLHKAGISIDTHGEQGTVTDQKPIGGEQWFRYQEFVLTYMNDSGTHTIGGPNADR